MWANQQSKGNVVTKCLLQAAAIGIISPVLLAGSRVYAALTVKASATVTQPSQASFSFPVRTMNSVTRASSHKVEVSGGSSGQVVRIDGEMDLDNWGTGDSQTGLIIGLLATLDSNGKYSQSKEFSYSVRHGNSTTGSQAFTVSAFTDITANNTINDHTTATKAYSVSYY